MGTRAPVVAGLLGLWLLATLGLRSLKLPDEGRYTLVAWEMLRGDPLVPTLFGLPYFHKPPLAYWINAAALQALGAGEVAARLAPALGGWLMGMALWLEVRSRLGAAAASRTLTVLGTMPFFFLGAQFANHDMLVAGCVTACIVAARRAAKVGSAGLVWAIAAWAAAAAGVLSKGLIGIVLPALAVVPVLIWRRDTAALRRLAHPAGGLVFLLLVLPWFAAMQWQHPGFADYFFGEQHFRRYTTAQFNNPQPLWFYAAALALLALPWTAWAWPALREAWRGRDGDLRADFWWFAVVLVFFSLPRSKLVGYVLPALPPLAALLATALARRPLAWRWTAAIAAVGCVALVTGLRALPGTSHRDIGLALGAQWRPDEAVLFVDGPYFDVPVYARLSESPRVLSDWDDPALTLRDNWRKELHDAARFAPAAGARVLTRTRDLPALLCAGKPLWVVAAPAFAPPQEWGEVRVVSRGRHAVLWRAAGRGAALCG